MVELDGVANAESFGVGINNCVAAVVVKGSANAESFPCAEVPCLVWSEFFVDGNFVSDWAEQCGIIFNGTIVIFPR